MEFRLALGATGKTAGSAVARAHVGVEAGEVLLRLDDEPLR